MREPRNPGRRCASQVLRGSARRIQMWTAPSERARVASGCELCPYPWRGAEPAKSRHGAALSPPEAVLTAAAPSALKAWLCGSEEVSVACRRVKVGQGIGRARAVLENPLPLDEHLAQDGTRRRATE